MKKLSLMLMLVCAGSFMVAKAQSGDPADKIIKMSKEKYDIGKIPQGVPYTFYMEFTNISSKPVVVENAMAGCGCTVPDKPVKPIMPGKTGKVKVVYNAAAAGPVNKDVEIKFAGINEPKIIYFTGEVLAKK